MDIGKALVGKDNPSLKLESILSARNMLGTNQKWQQAELKLPNIASTTKAPKSPIVRKETAEPEAIPTELRTVEVQANFTPVADTTPDEPR